MYLVIVDLQYTWYHMQFIWYGDGVGNTVEDTLASAPQLFSAVLHTLSLCLKY